MRYRRRAQEEGHSGRTADKEMEEQSRAEASAWMVKTRWRRVVCAAGAVGGGGGAGAVRGVSIPRQLSLPQRE